MPFGINVYPHAVVMNGKVYVEGGGYRALSDEENANTVMVYDPQFNVWNTLPQYDCAHFAMAVIQLVLVGGVHGTTETSSNMLGV